MAADCPKLRRKRTTLTRASRWASASSAACEPSVLPSSTSTISYFAMRGQGDTETGRQGDCESSVSLSPCLLVSLSASACVMRSCSLGMLSFSSLIGITIDRFMFGSFLHRIPGGVGLGIGAEEINEAPHQADGDLDREPQKCQGLGRV